MQQFLMTANLRASYPQVFNRWYVGSLLTADGFSDAPVDNGIEFTRRSYGVWVQVVCSLKTERTKGEQEPEEMCISIIWQWAHYTWTVSNRWRKTEGLDSVIFLGFHDKLDFPMPCRLTSRYGWRLRSEGGLEDTGSTKRPQREMESTHNLRGASGFGQDLTVFKVFEYLLDDRSDLDSSYMRK